MSAIKRLIEETIYNLYDEGYSIDEIISITGYSPEIVKAYLED